MSDEAGTISYERNDAIPQCGCQCHNRELGNVLAEVDIEGDPLPMIDAVEPEFWRDTPRWVDRRDEAEAVLACSKCKALHALAYSKDAAAQYQRERGITPAPRPELGGPQKQCQPDCRWCGHRDSIREDHT